MNFIQEVLNLLERKEDRAQLNLTDDWFEFGREKASSFGNLLYSPKMTPHAIRFDNLKCEIISGLISGVGQEYTLPMWSTVDSNNCNAQTIVDSIFSQNAQATEGKVTGDFKVTGNITLTGNPASYSVNAIVNNIEDSINDDTTLLTVEGLKNYNTGGGGTVSETVTSLSINANILTYTDENNVDTDIDLSLYLDDTNLSRLVSGALDASTGIATFTREDLTTFTLDLSSLLDTNTNDIDYISGVALNGSSLEITGVGNAFTGNIDLSGFGTVTSVSGEGTVNGITLSGTVTESGNLTLGGALEIDSADITAAIGYTPYNATNPDGFTSFAEPAIFSGGSTPTLASGITAEQIRTLIGAGDGTGSIDGVTGTAPIVSSGGTTPEISITAATTSAAGSMSAADKTKLDGIDDANYIKNTDDDFTPSVKVTQIVTLSQSQYDNLASTGTINANTIYIII